MSADALLDAILADLRVLQLRECGLTAAATPFLARLTKLETLLTDA